MLRSAGGLRCSVHARMARGRRVAAAAAQRMRGAPRPERPAPQPAGRRRSRHCSGAPTSMRRSISSPWRASSRFLAASTSSYADPSASPSSAYASDSVRAGGVPAHGSGGEQWRGGGGGACGRARRRQRQQARAPPATCLPRSPLRPRGPAGTRLYGWPGAAGQGAEPQRGVRIGALQALPWCC